MPGVPLSGFDPSFPPRCPKCDSSSVHFQRTRHSYLWGKADIEADCYVCGWVKYGETALRQAFEPQVERWKQRQHEAAVQREEARLRAEAEQEARLRAEQEARLRAEAEREAPTGLADGAKCACPRCNNRARPNSMYCSRNCSNKNARARYAACVRPPPPPHPLPAPGAEVQNAELRREVLARKARYETRA
jgi:hypothetical protein